MKKLSLLFIIAIVLGTAVLNAHPASTVTATFDKDTNLLEISFKHPVKDNADHYIKEITVTLNKQEIIRQDLSYQDSNQGGSLVYKINDLKPKDKLVIKTICSKFGTKSYTLVIE